VRGSEEKVWGEGGGGEKLIERPKKCGMEKQQNGRGDIDIITPCSTGNRGEKNAGKNPTGGKLGTAGKELTVPAKGAISRRMQYTNITANNQGVRCISLALDKQEHDWVSTGVASAGQNRRLVPPRPYGRGGLGGGVKRENNLD